jgi:hypothetical protein
MADEAERTEYVNGQEGVLFKGFPFWIQPVAWDFEQFGASTLVVLLSLLDRVATESGLDACADIVKLSRAFSALVNSNDDEGLVVGNWHGARFSTEMDTRGCYWFPRLLA